jgi:hypothetical protein
MLDPELLERITARRAELDDRINPAVSRGGEGSPAPVIPGCTRVERQMTARGASADEREVLSLP